MTEFQLILFMALSLILPLLPLMLLATVLLYAFMFLWERRLTSGDNP